MQFNGIYLGPKMKYINKTEKHRIHTHNSPNRTVRTGKITNRFKLNGKSGRIMVFWEELLNSVLLLSFFYPTCIFFPTSLGASLQLPSIDFTSSIASYHLSSLRNWQKRAKKTTKKRAVKTRHKELIGCTTRYQ